MIAARRGRLIISWLMLINWPSRSLTTVDFTIDSGTCGRSTMMSDRAVHRPGRKKASDAAAASTSRKGTMASTRRRRAISSTPARPAPRAGTDAVGDVVMMARRQGTTTTSPGLRTRFFSSLLPLETARL